MNAQSQLPVGAIFSRHLLVHLCHEILNFKRRKHSINSVSSVSDRYSARGHVSIADGFDLFEIVLLCNLVKVTKAAIQFLDQSLRRELFGDACESHHVCEENRGAVVLKRFCTAIRLQFFRNSLRQNVQQKTVRLSAFLVEISGQHHYQNACERLDEYEIA